ncbi:MAG TPA: PHP domain-containing protein [Bryobacteraceae bacterium]|jgi:histidinol phosphatase-like PHP family hydrolase/predicted nuclease with RNAse H fold/dephospho-CoA kinase
MGRKSGKSLIKAASQVASDDGLRAYFRLRDFEYVQPLYDLAFFLEVDALAKGIAVPKYRTFSLWRAAYSLDGYGTNVDRWLDNELTEDDLDYVPSHRIVQYLTSVRRSGTIPELKPFRGPRFDRCLKLRSVRGLGPSKIALTISKDAPDEEWFDQTAIDVALDAERLAESYRGNGVGRWQPAHIVPPMCRFLHRIEEAAGHPLKWVVGGIGSPFEPVEVHPSVMVSLGSAELAAAVKKATRAEPLFRVRRTAQQLLVQHQMRWAFSIGSDDRRCMGSLPDTVRALDPFAARRTRTIRSDLHLHTAWSDGSASADKMAQAVKDSGLSYFAVTDHSRSSKLQGGLTPVLWLKQANALALAAPICPVLHGIEVDILRNGQLDLPHSLLKAADLVVASVHTNWVEDPRANTIRVLSAIRSGCIDVLAHPTSALSGKPGVPDYIRPPVDIDWDEIFQECAKWRVAVEFNCFPSRLDLPLALLHKAVAAKCAISLGSDAHARSHLCNIRYGEAILKEISASVVLNNLHVRALKKWITESRKIRRQLDYRVTAIQATLFEESQIARPTLRATIVPPHRIPSGSRIVGIDLTAGEKLTGVAVLDGKRVEVCSLSSDEEILHYVAKHKPAIVSIDSPLGLPGGGERINPKAGIVRVAEHDLASIGIPAYPALIDSMRELTLRGIRLKSALERLKNPPTVIESYPGAAQDILCIPRKQKSLTLLREGLRRLGLAGAGLGTKSHDEMDAITSALVGRYFEAGQFEPMGIPQEAQLIVPKISPIRFDADPIICLAGKTGAGKSVVARYLSVFYGFAWIRTRDAIRVLLEEDMRRPLSKQLNRGTIRAASAITEEDLRAFGAIVLNDHKQVPLQRKLLEIVNQRPGAIVVDSTRDVADLDPKEVARRPLLTWFIDCRDSLIRHRLASKSKLGATRLKNASPVDYNAPVMKRAAHYIIGNNGTLEELRWRIDDTLFSDLDLRAHRPTS